MDPLTAFGLSANVFQVVNFSIDLVSHGYRIYKSTDGTLSEFSDTEKLATDLSDCNTLLLDYLHRVDAVKPLPLVRGNSNTTLVACDEAPGKPQRFSNADEQSLADLCRDCNHIADTLLLKLVKVKLRPGTSKTEWRAAAKAFRVAWDRSEIESINSRLRQYREQLNTRLLLSVRERLDRSATQHNGHLETLEEKARDILSTLMENRNEANMDISVLTTRLSRLIMAENEKTRELLNATLLQVSRATALEASRSSSLDVGSQLHDDSWVSISRANTPSPAPALSLHEAVRSGTLQQVRKILRSVRQNVDELDEEGCSALHTACVNKRFDIAKYLIQKGADVNQDDDTGSTPLHYAVQSGDAAFVRFLLSRHANRDFENDEGRKPFYYTDKNNWLLEWLRKWGHHVDAVDTVTGFTALIQAVRTGDEASVRELIDQGADLDAQCRTNNTALHYACESDNTSITSLLIDNRCKLDLKNKADWTPLMAAVRHGNLSAVQLLVSAGADLEATSSDEDYEKFTPLIAAIHEKHAPIACHLISAGAALHTRDHSGYTPINRAGQAGLLDVVRLLVERGQSINEQNCNSGWSVIAEAAFHDFPDIVDYLADLGANLETRDGNRDTPLQKASINGATESVRRLLAHGANPNTRNYWDWTPLHDAAIRGYAAIVELLLIAGAGTETRNSRDEGGNTALILASKEKECVRMLVHHGADVDATNEKGWTSLMEASHNGSVEVAEMLLMAGASIDVKDETERTAMDLAREGGHDDCARVLAEYGVN